MAHAKAQGLRYLVVDQLELMAERGRDAPEAVAARHEAGIATQKPARGEDVLGHPVRRGSGPGHVDEFLRETIGAKLAEIGFHRVSQAKDGNDALGQLERVDPELIICDISMKPMDGFGFVGALRKHAWPGAKDVPVIFLTVHTEAAMVKRAVTLKVNANVVKPVQKKQLQAQIHTVLENAALRG